MIAEDLIRPQTFKSVAAGLSINQNRIAYTMLYSLAATVCLLLHEW